MRRWRGGRGWCGGRLRDGLLRAQLRERSRRLERHHEPPPECPRGFLELVWVEDAAHLGLVAPEPAREFALGDAGFLPGRIDSRFGREVSGERYSVLALPDGRWQRQRLVILHATLDDHRDRICGKLKRLFLRGARGDGLRQIADGNDKIVAVP